jgi:hypothetical protein
MLLVAAVLAWLLARPRRARHEGLCDEDVDRETLEHAEDEVRDLDAFAAPEDADDDLPDWGPGAPKP